MVTDPPPRPILVPLHYHFLAGGIAGVTEICTMYPLDVVKTRFQLQSKIPSGAGGTHVQYTSVVDCFKKIVQNEGVSTLYRGLLPPVMVEAPRRAIKFAAYEKFASVYTNLFPAQKGTVQLSVAAGVSGGVIEGALVVAFELVKIRLQDPKNVWIMDKK